MGMSMFNVADSVPQLYKFTFSIVLILTISNALVIKIVEGGGNWKLLFYGGLMSGISGVCMIIIPAVVSRVFTFQVWEKFNQRKKIKRRSKEDQRKKIKRRSKEDQKKIKKENQRKKIKKENQSNKWVA